MVQNGTMRLLAVAAGLVMLLVSCGGEDTTEAGSGDGEGEEEYYSPLADYMGFGDFDQDQMEVDFEDQQREINEQIVTCMAAEGFEYLPEDDTQVFFDEPMSEDGLERDSAEWAAKYGFGISTEAFPQEMVGPDLLGFDDSSMMMGEDEYKDPNADYVATLSEADQEAFYATLHGDDPGPNIDEGMSDEEMDAAFEEWEENREPAGCMEMAWEQDGGIFGDENEEAFWTEFESDFESMWERMESHPKVVEAESKISECVAGKGFTYTSMEDVYEQFEKRMEPLYNIAYDDSAYEDLDLSEDEASGMTEQEMNDYYSSVQPEMSAEAKQQLGEIQADEIALAVAVNECDGGYGSIDDLYQEVRIELEQEFIDANRDRLDAFKDSQG